MLKTAAPSFSQAQAEALARDRFGIDAEARPLTSERDQNFHLKTQQGAEFVLKIANASEAPGVVAFQNAVMRHIENVDPAVPAPRVVPALDGAFQTMEQEHIVRILTWRAGRLMHQVERTPLLRQSLGRVHARMSGALRSCAAEPPPSDLLWNLQSAAQLRPLLSHVDAPGRTAALTSVLDRFESEASVWLEHAPAQVIHNDLNPHNVVVDEEGKVSGVIDFGDMVRAPVICDVAVAAAYHVRHDDAPMADVRQYVDAYCEAFPLNREELSLLPVLVALRLAMTVLITNWRASLYPENRAYILRNEPHAWRGLAAMMHSELRT